MIVFLDTNVVIYAVEGNPTFGARAARRLAMASASGDSFLVSDLTRLEALVGPLKQKDARAEAAFVAFFSRADVAIVGLTWPVCLRAANVRAGHPFKTMDALQLAAAAEHGADVFLTADARLASFTDVKVEVLR